MMLKCFDASGCRTSDDVRVGGICDGVYGLWWCLLCDAKGGGGGGGLPAWGLYILVVPCACGVDAKIPFMFFFFFPSPFSSYFSPFFYFFCLNVVFFS